ncbi:MAG TPA: PorP/SprF family type IX secretion system membrane protein [Chitinophagaceae bacterium]|nr:PorP/SprF family type IX secretion system membrane protein [Chitinophagaceae bacterium]
MKKLKIFIYVFVLIAIQSKAQDPSFSQFFSSPLNINPSLTANINADWRAIANFRDQWISPASPYATGTISYDAKMFQKKFPGMEEGNIFGLGGMLMYDKAMGGVVKSTYASLNMSYRVKLIDGETKHRLGAGFGAIYGHRRIDFGGIDFEEQFTGYGFNTNLPTGENSLSSMKPYFSVSTGLLYSITSANSNFDIGVSAFHVNKPKQTFLKDENQYLSMRKVIHANFETFLSQSVVLSTNAIYQSQETANYFSVGGALGYYLPNNEDFLLNAGLWYWSKNAIIPYIGIAYKDYQFGISYDVTISKLNQATEKPKTWELSLIVRGRNKPSYVIPCPWK